jgi:LPS-assembly lipoprotein
MSISRRKTVLASSIAALAAGFSLAGCGFHPLYGTAAAGSGLSRTFASVYVEPITDYGVGNTGYELRNALISYLDSNQSARYRLKASLNITTQGLALLTNASVTRYNDTLTVKYTLVDSETGQVVTQGIETGHSAYNVVASPYATLIAQQDSDKRAVQDVAERMRIELGVFFEQKKKSAAQ